MNSRIKFFTCYLLFAICFQLGISASPSIKNPMFLAMARKQSLDILAAWFPAFPVCLGKTACGNVGAAGLGFSFRRAIYSFFFLLVRALPEPPKAVIQSVFNMPLCAINLRKQKIAL
jgi:hypothetical protein